MSKVVVFNLPLHGHINPSLAVIKELVVRGEQVIYYTTEQFETKIQATGATIRRYAFNDAPLLALMAQAFQSIPQLLDEVRRELPDYILYNVMCLWGRLIAQILNIRAIALHATYASNEQFQLFSRCTDDFPMLSAQAKSRSAMHDEIQEIFKTYNIRPVDFFNPTSDDIEPLNIVFIPRSFQPQAETFDERFVFVGPSIQPRSESVNFSINQSQQPTLYISLGTIFNEWAEFFQMCFTAFGEKPWRVVMAIGNKVDSRTLGKIPENFIVAPHVPQLTLLQHTTVFLTHGGMNSVMESLYYGVPMIVIPQMPEQKMTAQRVAELNLGLNLEKAEVTASLLESAVTRVMNEPQWREHTRQIQQVLQATVGYQQAADEILRFTELITKETRCNVG
ncbi:MAG: glycosyltransferase [Rhizonema sp. PD38]|nr:glycosyltransferase [Rhizonema sp. PD38]